MQNLCGDIGVERFNGSLEICLDTLAPEKKTREKKKKRKKGKKMKIMLIQ